MQNTVIRVYNDFSAAQSARAELLSHGFSEDSVQLSVSDDESGPVEGNFVEDQKDTGTGPGATMHSPEERTDAYNDDHPVWRGICQLVVAADDEARRAQASEIMDRFGAIDIDARTRGAGPH